MRIELSNNCSLRGVNRDFRETLGVAVFAGRAEFYRGAIPRQGGIHTRNFGGYGSHRTNIHGISRRDLPLGKSSMIGQHINDPQYFFLGIVKMCRYPDAAETECFDDFMIPKNLV